MLFPPILRDLVLGLADRGLFTPLWSAGVAAEWLHVTARKGETGAAQALARMQARWPGAEGPPGDPALLRDVVLSNDRLFSHEFLRV